MSTACRFTRRSAHSRGHDQRRYGLAQLRTQAGSRPSGPRSFAPSPRRSPRRHGSPTTLAPASPAAQFAPPQPPLAEDRLAAYFDTRTKAQARLAPVALFLLVALVVIVYLALR